MKKTALISLMLASGLLGAASSASAMTVADFGKFTVTYDESTVFGGISFSFGSGDQVGFGWNIPSSVSVSNTDAGSVTTNSFDLPDFTVTADPGWMLSGAIGGFMGNLVYAHVGSATSSANVGGMVSIDGLGPVSAGGSLSRTATLSIPGLETGYYSVEGSAPYGTFSTFSFSSGVLALSASGGTAAITGQPQNEFKFYFDATPVPEPETYAMMLAGLGLIGFIAARRRNA